MKIVNLKIKANNSNINLLVSDSIFITLMIIASEWEEKGFELVLRQALNNLLQLRKYAGHHVVDSPV